MPPDSVPLGAIRADASAIRVRVTSHPARHLSLRQRSMPHGPTTEVLLFERSAGCKATVATRPIEPDTFGVAAATIAVARLPMDA